MSKFLITKFTLLHKLLKLNEKFDLFNQGLLEVEIIYVVNGHKYFGETVVKELRSMFGITKIKRP